jgi:sterol desaturase/sphingolipid hydroxylase (fatty acid hydroxylase superfamily)
MLEAFARAVLEHGELAQYIAFLGLLVILGGLELVVPRLARLPDRRHRWFANFGLTAVNIVVLGALPVSGIAAAVWAETYGFGLLNAIEAPVAAVVLLTLAARSLISYGVHASMHRVPLLWRFHRVHHLDTHLDVSTTARFHPIEFVLGAIVLIPSIALLGLSAWVLMVYEVLDAAANVFTHSNVRIPSWADRIVRVVLVTPDMHRVHHSSFQPETDSNYGAVFSFWDRVFGTYRAEPRDGYERLELGLDHPRGPEAQALGWLLGSPFVRPPQPAGAQRSEPGPSRFPL